MGAINGILMGVYAVVVIRPLGGLADISVSENHYCIKSFCRLKTLEQRF